MKFWLFTILLSVSATAYAEPKPLNVKDLVQQVLAGKEVDPRLIAEAAEREEKANYSTKNPDKTEGKGFNFFGLFGGSDKNKVVEDSRKFIETEDFRRLPASVQEKVRKELENAKKQAQSKENQQNPSKPYTTGNKGDAKDKAVVRGNVTVAKISNEKLNMQRYLDGAQDLEDLRAELSAMLAMLKADVTATESAVNIERTRLRSLESRARSLYDQMTGIQNFKNSLNNRYQNAQRRLAAINAEKRRRAEAARKAAEAARRAAEAARKAAEEAARKAAEAAAKKPAPAPAPAPTPAPAPKPTPKPTVPTYASCGSVPHGATRSQSCSAMGLGYGSIVNKCENGKWKPYSNTCSCRKPGSNMNLCR